MFRIDCLGFYTANVIYVFPPRLICQGVRGDGDATHC